MMACDVLKTNLTTLSVSYNLNCGSCSSVLCPAVKLNQSSVNQQTYQVHVTNRNDLYCVEWDVKP